MTASNNILCKLLVLWLAVERKLVRWLSVRHFVDLEPFHCGLAGLESIQGLFKHRIHFTLRKPGMILSTSWMSFRFSARGSLTSIAITLMVFVLRLIYIDAHLLKLHLPVGLTLIDHRKHSKDLDLEDGASEEKINWWLIVGNMTEYMEDQLIIDIAWQIKPSNYLGWIVDPISQTSIGSLSPLQLVDGSVWLGSSHVCQLQMLNIEQLYIVRS